MKIGIDISQIIYEGTGVSRFTKGLVNSILKYDKKNQWTFFFSGLRQNLDKKTETEIIKSGHKLIKWKLPPTLLSFLWNNLHQLSALITNHYSPITNLNWFITSDWTEPPLKNINKATVVHDLVYKRYPETINDQIRKTQELRLKHVKKESKIIFADSQATKKDLIELLNIEENRIVVNYPGVDIIIPTENQIKKTLEKYNLQNKKFILTVGKLEPRKNFKRLIEAMKKSNDQTINLIIVGPSGWEKLYNIKCQNPNIKYLGLISDQELSALYQSCLFFIFPSLWEGFGYPIIEAMKYKVPVACSNTSSIKEIAGKAALFFDPYDITEMTQCIDELSQNVKLREQLINEGEKREKVFTWKKYYNTLIKTLNGY